MSKPHQFTLHPTLKVPILRPRFQTSKHRGASPGAFGGRTKASRDAMNALISALMEALPQDALAAPDASPAPLDAAPYAVGAPEETLSYGGRIEREMIEPLAKQALDDQMARAVDVVMKDVASTPLIPDAPVGEPLASNGWGITGT